MTATLSKKAIAAAVYVQMTTEGKRRKDIVFTMCEKAGLTEAGASTYYNNFRTGVWKIATPTAVASAVAPVAVVLTTPTAPAAPAVEVVAEQAPVEVTASAAIATTEDGGDIFGAVVHAHLAGLGVIPAEEPPVEEVVAEVVEVPAEEVAVVDEVVAVDYSVMSKAELVTLYNSKSTKPVKDFRNHETAVRRVTELFAG